jgi:hypothetical protein
VRAGVQAGEHQGETDSHHQIAAGGRQHALPAVFRLPGFGIVGVSGDASGMFVDFNSSGFGFS